ncbi:hypothetical protein ACJJTC_018255 [Scirpophaga incertulas]
MYLNIFESYMKVKRSQDEKKSTKACKEWCHKMFINYKVMEKACEIRNSLEKLIKGKFQIENKVFEGPDLGSAKCVRVMKCVVAGAFLQAAHLAGDCSYRGARGATLHISPDSCLYHTQQPSWVLFGTVQSSGDKTYMRDLMAIEKEWLLELAPHYYKES